METTESIRCANRTLKAIHCQTHSPARTLKPNTRNTTNKCKRIIETKHEQNATAKAKRTSDNTSQLGLGSTNGQIRQLAHHEPASP